MIKIQRISEFQHRFPFLCSTELSTAYHARFLQSDLGKIYSAIPWTDLVEDFGIKESHKGPFVILVLKGNSP